jgi:dipeptidyl aminopeptidase/acylaminoacyl peptidase
VRLVAPRSLPGARALLVTASPDLTAGRIGVLDLESGRLRQFGSGLGARYVDGRLIYAGLRGELFSQPFDLDRLEPTGEAAQLASGLDAVIPNGRFAFDATAGAVVYHLGAGESANNGKLTLTDSAGGTPRVLPGRTPWAPRFSPDGRRIAYGAYAPGRDSSDIWIADLESGTAQRLTTDGDDNNDPVWSPDGRRIAYDKNAEGGKDVFLQSLDGGSARVLTRRPGFQWPTDWARDGRTVLFTDVTAAGQYDLWVQPSDAGEARPYLTLPARETGARLSPDGRWVAYQSDETGRYEVYVQSYPTTGRKTLISLGGGVNPVWRADGRMLYYWRVDELLAARLDSGGSEGSLIVRSRTPLFRAPYVESALPMYDVSPDGTRFVIVMGEAQVSRLVVALGALDAHERGRNAAR